MKMNKRGQAAAIMTGLLATVVAFVVVVIATSLVSGIVGNIRTGQVANSYEYNVSTQGLTGLTNLSSQYGNIGTIVAVGAIIGILVGAFAFFRSR